MTIRDRPAMRNRIIDQYRSEHDALGESGTLELLERGRCWNLSGTLTSGGVVIFPHAGVADCGHQIAAAVHAALDSGADTILVISVLHAFTQAMEDARIQVAEGANFRHYPTWGIQGPGISGGRQEWRNDHALFSWRYLLDAELKRREIKSPRVIERYPYLAGGRPDLLPGIDELAAIAENSVIVTTADPFHHGIGYGTRAEEALPPDETGIAAARESIYAGLNLLEAGDYWGYNQHCVRARSDARDAGQVIRYLRGPLQGEILDIVITDTCAMYNTPAPTWVAGALVDWTPKTVP